ncbi:MAG: RNA polymerase sigma factor [Terriglobales bacterium]
MCDSGKSEAGREAAWRELVRRLQPAIAAVVLRGIWRWGGDPASVADDLVQETLLKLCVNDGRILLSLVQRPEPAIVGYVKAIASNLTNDHFRASHAIKRGRDAVAVADLELPAELDSTRHLDRSVLLAEIEDCLQRSRLGPTEVRDRRIFHLYYRQGLSARAIAAQPEIGLSVDGVESSLKRVTRLLRAQLVEAQTGMTAAVTRGGNGK